MTQITTSARTLILIASVVLLPAWAIRGDKLIGDMGHLIRQVAKSAAPANKTDELEIQPLLAGSASDVLPGPVRAKPAARTAAIEARRDYQIEPALATDRRSTGGNIAAIPTNIDARLAAVRTVSATQGDAITPATNGLAAPSSLPSNGSPTGQMREIAALMTQRGIIDYKLESWGSAGNLFRFQARVPLPQAPNLQRHFEAIGNTPADAVAGVTAQVDGWLTGR